MALVTLPNLYATPQDVADYLGSEGVQLRLDDRGQATGQTVQCVIDAALGATSVSVAPLSSPLPRGSVLEFDGGGMAGVVEVVLSATARLGDTSLTVLPLAGPVNALGIAFDNGVNVAQNARVTKALQYATAQVKSYCCPRYDDSALATSWSVNRWAMVIAARWIAKRRSQAAPQGIESDWEEVKEELWKVRASMINIEDIGTRTTAWPYLSNCTIDIGYDTAKTRVERPISEATPTNFGQYVDWSSELFFDI